MNKAKIERAPQQYDAKHLTEESCCQPRSIQEPMQLSSRGKQMVWPSGGDNDREHREQDSRGREHQLGIETFQFEISILPKHIAKNCRKEIDTRNMNSVVSALTTGIDAAVSQAQQVQQFQTTVDDEQSLESETNLHRGEQDGQRHCRQQAGKVR